jgi:hypothetical protein
LAAVLLEPADQGVGVLRTDFLILVDRDVSPPDRAFEQQLARL